MKKLLRTMMSCIPFLALPFGAGCGSSPVTCQAPPPSPDTLATVETGNSEFATDLLGQLSQNQSGNNFFYSPYSISSALGMTYAGAATKTAQQMAEVLHLTQSAPDVPQAFASLDCQIETNGQANGNQLSIANGLFGQQGFTFSPTFLSLLQNDYGASLQQVDFVNNANGAIQTIDQWVSNQTQGQIPELYAPGSLDPSTRLVLADAIYFKGSWASAFDPANTQSGGTFQVTASQQVTTPLMNQTADFGYAKGQGFTLLELPYQGGKIAMDILLPDAVDGLPALVSSFSAASFQTLSTQLQSQNVQVTLPKLKLASSFELKPTLVMLGMPLAFDESNADFSGIDGQHDLYISSVVHKATLEVDESGSVATAATGVSVTTGAVLASNVFNANHPFLLVLRDLGTGTLLFVGQVTDPTKS